jgi:hypothetical protein
MTSQVYKEIKNVFSEDTFKEIADFAKDPDNYNLCGYDPLGFWDNRAKKIEPEQFRRNLTYELVESITLPEDTSEINPVTLVKFLDESCTTDGSDYAIHPHYFKNPPHYWNYQVIIMLNDDYEGGEIVFPDQNITIKQKANSAICFDGDTIYQINKVTSGKKYMITLFGK